jgi:hypothetical protein
MKVQHRVWKREEAAGAPQVQPVVPSSDVSAARAAAAKAEHGQSDQQQQLNPNHKRPREHEAADNCSFKPGGAVHQGATEQPHAKRLQHSANAAEGRWEVEVAVAAVHGGQNC